MWEVRQKFLKFDMRWLKCFVVMAFLVVLMGGVPTVAKADGPDLNGGGRDPNYVYSPQELEAIAAKKAKAKHYMQKKMARLSPEEPDVTNILYVPETDAFKEKNDYAHRNYCGPAATKIILYSWVGDGVALPTMNEIGQGEQIDPSWGVYNVAVRDYLNDWLQAQGEITLT